MKETHIHLVRHGEVHNPAKILYGRLPRFGLSRNGRRQAREAGRFLADLPIQAIFSSPLLRARQTAAEIMAVKNAERLGISRLLNEVHTAYEGVPSEQVDRKRGDIYSGVGNGFEQPADVAARAQKFIARMRRRFEGRQVAAVTHGDVVTFTVLWALGWDLVPRNKTRLREAGFPAAYPAHASVTTLVFNSTTPDDLPVVTYRQPW